MVDSPVQRVQLLCLDVDGVLTDGRIVIDDHGVEAKRFHVRDGAGIWAWRSLGYEAAIITGRQSMAVRHRAREVGIEHVIQGRRHKVEAFGELLQDLDLRASDAAMIGDDLPDLQIMGLCGYPIAVADAAPEVREVAELVTSRPGGHGAVREAIEHILKAHDRWDEALALFG